jgi:hypothetical protein
MNRKDFYQKLAKLIGASHFFLLGWIAVGTIIQFLIDWYVKIHLPVLILTSLPSLLCFGCPITVLERQLRKKACPETPYQNFWSFYVKRKLPKFLVPGSFLILIGLSLLNLLI